MQHALNSWIKSLDVIVLVNMEYMNEHVVQIGSQDVTPYKSVSIVKKIFHENGEIEGSK